MAYPASLLISRAWVLSGIVARELQGVQGNQSSDGLYLLNELLAIKAADISLIPYYQHTELTLLPNVNTYFVENLVALESMTFNIGSVRYSMQPVGRTEFFGSSRALDIKSIPFEWYSERVENGSNVYVYFTPDQTYEANLNGKYGLTNVTLATDLSNTYDTFYLAYLRYALAEYMCEYYEQTFPADKQKTLITIIKKLKNVSPPDLSLEKSSNLGKRQTINYGDVNIGKGYRPY